MDLSATFDTDSPVLWVRVDPDMTWARRVSIEQPDYMWQYQLRYERNVTSQIEVNEFFCFLIFSVKDKISLVINLFNFYDTCSTFMILVQLL